MTDCEIKVTPEVVLIYWSLGYGLRMLPQQHPATYMAEMGPYKLL